MDAEEFKKKFMKAKIDISVMRGLVMTEAVNIEAHMGVIITSHFAISNKHSDFSTMVLEDPYFSFGLKVNILKKIIKKIKWETYREFNKEIYRVEELRNIFAHSIMYGFEGDLMYQKRDKTMENKKAKEMYDEFMSLYLKVEEELDKLFWHIIGKPNPFKKE